MFFRRWALPAWAPMTAFALSVLLAWLNFLTTGRWASLTGALNGWRRPWYALALAALTVLLVVMRRRVGAPVPLGRAIPFAVLVAGPLWLVAALLSRFPPSTWTLIPFKDDWTPLYQQAVNGIALLKRGTVVGWNWGLLGGYPTSTDIAQNFSTVAFIPMTLLGNELGYHVLHAFLFAVVPIFIWYDLRTEPRETRLIATGLAGFFAAGYLGPLGNSGDTNSLVGVFCAGLAVVGSHAAREGKRFGGPLLMLGLTLGLYTHTAFFVYGAIYVALECVYFRDKRAALRLVAAVVFAGVAALPMHWESLQYPKFVSFNNTVYNPDAPPNWAIFARTVYYNFEILLLPHRWFNDYRSIANVWLPALIVAALAPGRSRAGYYAVLAVTTQLLLRFNTAEAGAGFDRIQHMFPLLMAPALAGFIARFAGSRAVAAAMLVVVSLYVYTSFQPIKHVRELRDFDPPLIDRIAASDGMILVEISPHRDMDSHPVLRSQTTPFDVHFEGLLPWMAGQRFYTQSIDGWVWSIWRGQVVGAATFRGRPIAEVPVEDFVAEMEKWGVRHLFVWTDNTRRYLAADQRFVERWRGGRWSHFERSGSDTRAVVTATGSGTLADLDPHGASVHLAGTAPGEPVVVRTNFYPAWKAFVDGERVELFNHDGQLAFRAPRAGAYTVRLEYPRYRALVITALAALLLGGGVLTRWPRR